VSLSPKIDASLRPDGQKCLVANVPIRKNEILITYGGPSIDHPRCVTSRLVKRSPATDWEPHERVVCHCGAPHCYGELKGLKYLTRDEQKKLLRFLPDFMKRKVCAED
jgi:hypothetical protein